jgi:hypothetical protein
MMRIVALMSLVTGMLIAAAPAAAQTYAPGYPVCLHVFGPVTYFDCSYTSIAQCNLTASGRSAQCVVNPYHANAGMGEPAPPVRYHHHYRHYHHY